jgi:hypothetical protein
MSTEYTLEDVLNFLDNEEQSSEFTDTNVAKMEKEKISDPPKVVTPEKFGGPDDEGEDDAEEIKEESNKETHQEEVQKTSDGTEDEDDGEIPKAYYEFLQKNNVLFVDDEFKFDGTPESLETALTKTKENLAVQAINALWTKLSPEFQAALKYNLDGGTDFGKFAETYGKPTDLSKYDLKKIEDQKAVVAQYYKLTSNYTDERINKFINKLIETEDLYDEAEEAADYIKKHEDAQRAKLLEETEKNRFAREKAQEEWRNSVVDTMKELGIPDARKSKVQAFLLNPVQKGNVVSTDFERTLTAIFSNPQHYVQLADLLYNYDPKKGLDLSRFVDKNKTQSTSKFQQELEEALKTSGRSRGGSPQIPTKSSQIDWESVLDQLDN